EVRVRVRAAAVNFPDLLMTGGGYQLKPDLPFVSGLEFSGEVDAVGGGVDGWTPGDAVVGGNRFGAMAEYAVVPAGALRRKPDALNWDEAAAYPVAYLTAWVALVRCARVEPGEWVLVHGAAGGVGLATVDLAKTRGARVIAVASSADKREAIARLYAPDAVISAGSGFREEVKALTDGRGADVIFDPVGGDVFDESTRCIAFGGRLLVIGFASGRIPEVSVNMPLIKGFSVIGVRAGEYGRRFPDRGAENVSAIDALAATGKIRPHVHASLDLADWREGFAMLERRETVGKVVLKP
ncbi:MAG TPA: NADPH:quinone oxidoreductase family protein, partial [Sphingopyxis sp.]|nr:NADPH:quinone oxidoreductase family protein [Sphingopyxis sp.]